MLRATDKDWNSPTTLYIARRLQEIADGKRISVLDMGCGDGKVLGYLLDHGYDLYGYDLVYHEDIYNEARRKRLAPYFGDSYDEHIRLTQSERTIPFDDDSFDVVYSNQVFEHVKFLDKMISEGARVLKPNGIFLLNFPLATYPIEGHTKIPFAHWIPPGKARIRYLQLFCSSGLRRFKRQGKSNWETAVSFDEYLRDETFYRFMNEILAVSNHYFEYCEVETGALIRAKADMLESDKEASKRMLGKLIRLVEGEELDFLTTHLYNAAFCMRDPKKRQGISG